ALPRPPDAASQLTLPAVAHLGATGAARSAAAAVAAEPGSAWPPGGRVALAGGPTRLRITSPENGARLLRDPETPAALNTVALRAVVDPPVNEVVWYVDGLPVATAAYPYTARWRLQPGEHTFQVRLGSGASASRRVQVTVE
ncbi:MAG TPA: Ig-like domain-containing protein, partial [Thermoanaerobaculia bacterium]|nr:Ig-like domain-containing protein [Thermoanaerobaculia bacterium]